MFDKKKSNYNTKYRNLLYNNSVIPSISKVTREEIRDGRLSTSCIDHVNYRFNRHFYTGISSVITDKLADHYFIALRITAKNNSVNSTRSHQYSPPELINILDNRHVQNKIQETDWDELRKIEDPNVLYQTVISRFNNIYKEATKTIQKRDTKHSLPWINDRIKFEIEKKKDLLQKWRNDKNNLLMYEQYKKQRNITTNTLKKEKRIYIFKLFQEAKGNSLKTWKIINDILSRKIKEPIDQKLQVNFKTTDLSNLANRFNLNFVQQITDIKDKNSGPVLDVQFVNHQLQCEKTSMYLRKAKEKEIRDILKRMKKTGKGIDGLRNMDLICNDIIFSPLITHLINLMLTHSIIPDQLKISSITPLYKKGPADVLGNYRPVGTLPIIEKVFEKYVNNVTRKYLEENDIIPQFQHGFQRNRSTITLLQDFSNKVYTALDQRKFVIVIFLDLSFAFDTCDHSRLLVKFRELGMSHNIFKSYFEARKQVTRIGTHLSDQIRVNNGLVQGGVNSPTWYNVYTHDVKYLKRKGDLLQFADDSCILSVHTELEQAVKNAQSDFINLQKYLYNNHIFLNEKKTEALIICNQALLKNQVQHKIYCHSRSCLENKTYEQICNCHQLEYADRAKYLGVFVDKEFKMNEHADTLTKKLRILKFKFNKINADHFPLSAKKMIYFSLVDAVLRYGVTLYTHAPQYAMNPLNSLQRKIRNFLFGQYHLPILTPQQLATYVLLCMNFYDRKYRQLTNQPYNLRIQRFARPRVYTIQYGEKRLEYILPTLLNKYCQEFLEEENKFLIKRKIRDTILDIR